MLFLRKSRTGILFHQYLHTFEHTEHFQNKTINEGGILQEFQHFVYFSFYNILVFISFHILFKAFDLKNCEDPDQKLFRTEYKINNIA